MTTEKDPSYPWYPRDFMADGPVMLMSLEEEGAYRRLLDYQWLHGSIPNDLTAIARICKNVTRSKMARMWPAISECFPHVDGHPAQLQNRRLERIRHEREEYRRQASEKGRKGAEARWSERDKQSAGHSPGIAPGIARAMPADGSALAVASATETPSSPSAREDREEPDLTALTAKAKQVQATVEAAATGPEAAVQVAGFRAMVYKSRSPHGFLCEIGALLDGLRMTPAPTPGQVLAAVVRMYTNGCPAEARVLHGYVRWAITGEEPKDTRRTDFDRRRGTRATSAVPPRDESLPRLTG